MMSDNARILLSRRHILGLMGAGGFVWSRAGRAIAAGDYNPLVPDHGYVPHWIDRDIDDPARNRVIPVRIFMPVRRAPCPLILFSHGLGGSREGYAYAGQFWAGRGYVVIMLQHPGSDSAVWKDTPLLERKSAMQVAASRQNAQLRIGDVHRVLDVAGAWNERPGSELYQALDMNRVGMAGHSFGAHTTLAVAGQVVAYPDARDKRITAALAMSPSPPAIGNINKAFGNIDIPLMLMTGTEDNSPIGNTTPQDRRKVYPALNPGGKYELVMNGANHMIFARGSKDDHFQRSILAISTAFWDSWLRGSRGALAWLEGDTARTVLADGDLWQHK